jgi:hypothetical protein
MQVSRMACMAAEAITSPSLTRARTAKSWNLGTPTASNMVIADTTTNNSMTVTPELSGSFKDSLRICPPKPGEILFLL